MSRIVSSFLVLLLSLCVVPPAFSHCEIPCGIYEDAMRLDLIGEHITTIEKSLKMIANLSKDEDKNVNQLVRWIGNKEKHAQEIQVIVYQYFMTQRIKPAGEEQAEKHQKYLKELRLLHEMLIAAMKSKQSLDTQNVTKLRALLSDFRTSYLGEQTEKEHAH